MKSIHIATLGVSIVSSLTKVATHSAATAIARGHARVLDTSRFPSGARLSWNDVAVDERVLSADEAAKLRLAPFTYDDVARTLSGHLPEGYSHLQRSREIGSGAAPFEQATRTLLGWDMHRRAGVQVRAATDRVIPEAVAALRLGVGRLSVDAPVRVVAVIDEPRCKGFAYGTLPGHPESGEEAFVVELQEDGAVTFTITAFSRPATRLSRLGGPVTGAIQSWVTNRYLRSV